MTDPQEADIAELVVIAFQDESTAFALSAEPAKRRKEYLVYMEDSVVATKATGDQAFAGLRAFAGKDKVPEDLPHGRQRRKRFVPGSAP